MIHKNCAAAILTMLLATAGSAWAVQVARSAGNDGDATKTGTEQEAAEAEIWALEQAYWQSNRDADHQRIISFWHDRFLGWPDGEPRPIDKEAGARYVRENYARPASYSFEIEPAGVRVLGKVAVNHYTVHLKWNGAEAKKRSMRITHTWVHDGTGWKILGGMSANP